MEDTQYKSDEECEETEEYVKSNNPEAIGNDENLEKEDAFKKYDYIPERFITSNLAPRSFNEYLLIKKKFKAICKILNGEHPGTGFFCKINLNGKEIKALFTNNHVLGSNRIKVGSKINLLNNKSEITIEINKKRFICSSRNLDYTCIQILPEDNINDFLKIDRQIYEEYMEEYSNDSIMDEYKLQNLILVQYCRKNEGAIYYSTGSLENFDGTRIFYKIPIQFGAKGAPILSLNNSLDVIGMHRKCGSRKKRILNNGIFFNRILIDIQSKI